MPRQRKPEPAAKAIVDMIANGQASSVDDAVTQRPELSAGGSFLKQAVSGSPHPSGSESTSPRPRPTGSGSVLLSR